MPALRCTSRSQRISVLDPEGHVLHYHASSVFASSQFSVRLAGTTRHLPKDGRFPAAARTVPGTGQGFAPRALLRAWTDGPRRAGVGKEERDGGLTFSPPSPAGSLAHACARPGTRPRPKALRPPACRAPGEKRDSGDPPRGAARCLRCCLPAARSGVARSGAEEDAGVAADPRYHAPPAGSPLYLPPRQPAWAPARARQPITASAARRGPLRHWAPKPGSAVTSCPAP